MITNYRPVLDPLMAFVDAGILGTTEMEVVVTVAHASREANPDVLLALALAVRAPIQGHVCVDLTEVATTLVPDESASPGPPLPWPDVADWQDALRASPLVSTAPILQPVAQAVAPLVLEGTRLYLHRYWQYEVLVATELLRRTGERPDATERLAAAQPSLDRLFPDDPSAGPDSQREAVVAALSGPLTVIAGGPGTGKTHTIARLLAVLHESAAGDPPTIALAAPTGKAAARMAEALRHAVATADLAAPVADALGRLEAQTIHRLLGANGRGGFRRDRSRPVPADYVIIDETSMVSLPLMSRLLAAVRPEAHLVLVGDPSQLASVEAGAVLGDLISPTGPGRLRQVTLDRGHRFATGSAIAGLADAVRSGDVAAALALLADPAQPAVRAIEPADASASAVTNQVLDAATEVVTSAVTGDANGTLALLNGLKVLSATRRGLFGVDDWNRRVERALADGGRLSGQLPWYVGRPVIVTRNDYLNHLANGDSGAVVAPTERGGRSRVAFPAEPEPRLIDPSRLDQVDTQWAMTIHKSQGSEFDHVIVCLPPAPSPILTRELLYTAITRARSEVTIIASEASLIAAVSSPVARASGLADRLS